MGHKVTEPQSHNPQSHRATVARLPQRHPFSLLQYSGYPKTITSNYRCLSIFLSMLDKINVIPESILKMKTKHSET